MRSISGQPHAVRMRPVDGCSPRGAELASASPSFPALSFPPFLLDLINEQLWRDGEQVSLKPRAFAVLRYLLEHPQRLVTKRELLDNVWREVTVGDAVLKAQLWDIRLALGDIASAPRFIETVHGRGYRFVAPVHRVPQATASRGELAEGGPSLVARETELARLKQAFGEAEAGRRQVVFVTGPAGIGKTSLVESFCEVMASQTGVRLARGQCVDQYGVDEAYLPLAEALARIGRGPEGSALVTVLRRHAPSWLSQLPALLTGEELPVQRTVGPSAAPERMLREMADALEAFAVDKPLVLLLEDLHWADRSTLTWIAYFARRRDPTRLLLLATYRPLEAEVSEHPLGAMKRELELQRRCTELALPCFDHEDIETYLFRRFGAHHFPRSLVPLLLSRTGGSPLFVTKVLDSWTERGLVRQNAGHWQLGTGLHRLAVAMPASIVALIENECDRLTPQERQVLDAASVVGLEFSAASVAAALERDLVEVEDVCLSWARRGQFIRLVGTREWPDGTVATQCEFIHALYHQTLYERLGPARQMQLHQRIGARQEAAHGGRAQEIAAELALHFERGGDRKRALSYLSAAGAQALSRSAYQEAVAHFDRALGLLPHVEDERERLQLELGLQVASGGALGMTLGHAAAEVERRYARARLLCQNPGETGRLGLALSGILVFYLVRGDYRSVCELAQAALPLEAEPGQGHIKVEANVILGIARIMLGHLAEGLARLEEAIALYESSPLPSTRIQMLDTSALARTMAGLASWLLGFPDRGLRFQEEALALGERFRDPCCIALASATRVLLLQLRGDTRAVLDQLGSALEHCAKHGFIYYLANLRMLGGVSATVQTGEWKERVAGICADWEAVRATGSEFGDTRLCSLVALAHARGGSATEAFRLLDRALERVESNGERWWEPELYRMLGELVLQTRSVREASCIRWALPQTPASCAEACFFRALDAARSIGAKSLELRAALSLARWWQKRGRTPEAYALLHEIYSWFSEGLATGDLMDARQLLAELAPASKGASQRQTRSRAV
jgi:DNA-binding winged helix-turn-helix (wHTH) protein/predicted ATPase